MTVEMVLIFVVVGIYVGIHCGYWCREACIIGVTSRYLGVSGLERNIDEAQ